MVDGTDSQRPAGAIAAAAGQRLAKSAGTLLIAFSAFCFGAAVWRQMARIAPPEPDTRRFPPALLIVVNGFLALVSLAALIGIWAA